MAALAAQTSSTSTVVGRVEDRNGGAIDGARIAITDLDSNQVRRAVTNAAGQYVLPGLSPGRYTVTASAPGFQNARMEQLAVDVARAYQANFKLEIGAITETVEVKSGAEAELQTLDSTTGATIKGEQLLRLPSINRSAIALLMLQPMTIPVRGAGIHVSGQVGGARSDQSAFHLDGVDATDLTAGTGQYISSASDWSGPTPMIPIPAESIEEFRVGTSNANATFGRSSGGQVNLITRRGSNSWHGSGYWYLQNDKLNANRWDFNRTGVARPALRDNRYGVSIGGALRQNKTFLFANYEGRRLPQRVLVTRLVPSETLRQGVLRFVNSGGQVQSYDARAYDPRGIGLSPVMRQYLNLYPSGNDTTLGDSLNTTGFRGAAAANVQSDFGVVRLDHHWSDAWRLNASYRYAKQSALSTSQVDIAGIGAGNTRGIATPGGRTPVEPRFFSFQATGVLSPRLFTEVIAGYARNYWAYDRTTPTGQVPGTAGALNLADSFLNQPLDVSPGSARSRQWRDNTYQLRSNSTYLLGKHTIQFGGAARWMPSFHERNDKVVGSLAALIFDVNSRNGFSLGAANRPANLRSADSAAWDDLLAGSLGVVSRAGVVATRDRDLNLLPPGTPIRVNTRWDAYDVYVNDVWRVTPRLTVTFGLNYLLQTVPTESDGLQTLVTDANTREVLTGENIVARRTAAALKGDVYNPVLAWIPVRTAGAALYQGDHNNLAPRISAAYQWGKTVVRGGYSRVFDRVNGATNVFFPSISVGFSQTATCTGPRRDGTCAIGSDLNSAFRIGVDGSNIALPVPARLSVPFVLPPGFTEQLSMGIDPAFRPGQADAINFTVQRELPANFVVEAGFAGRYGRNLPQSTSMSSVPYFMKDAASGQTFGQAFDAIAGHLRSGGTAVNAPVQPWFENQLARAPICVPNCSVALASRNGTAFTQGLLNTLWNVMEGQRGTEPFVTNQLQELWMRTSNGYSNYHAGFLSVSRRLAKGAAFSLNHTLSRSLDIHGFNQEAESKMSNALTPRLDYAVSAFDRTHVFNSNGYYELPWKKGNRWICGWYIGGIFTASSGVPLTSQQSAEGWGGAGVINAIASGLIPTGPLPATTVHSEVRGTNGIGISSDPARSGSGLNLFANPESVFNSFRPLLVGSDGRNGRHRLRGLSRWNVDLSLGKKTRLTESLGAVFTADFINATNRAEFADPALNYQSRGTFGVLTTQYGTPRQIQLGLRLEF